MFKKYSLVTVLAVLISAILLPTQIQAAQYENGNYTLDPDITVAQDLYVTGNNIIIKGVVDGDLILMGENITMEGTVTGDLYAFGSSHRLKGNLRQQ